MLLAKKISNFIHGFKSAVLEKLKNCQNGTFEPRMKFKNFGGQKPSKWHLIRTSMKCIRVHQIQDLCSKKYKKGIF